MILVQGHVGESSVAADVESVDPRAEVLKRIEGMQSGAADIIGATARFKILKADDMHRLLNLQGGLAALRRMCTSDDRDADPQVVMRFTIQRLERSLVSETSASTN